MNNYTFAAEEILVRALTICALAALFWWRFVLAGQMTLERLFADMSIGVGIGFAINIIIAIVSPESFNHQ